MENRGGDGYRVETDKLSWLSAVLPNHHPEESPCPNDLLEFDGENYLDSGCPTVLLQQPTNDGWRKRRRLLGAVWFRRLKFNESWKAKTGTRPFSGIAFPSIFAFANWGDNRDKLALPSAATSTHHPSLFDFLSFRRDLALEVTLIRTVFVFAKKVVNGRYTTRSTFSVNRRWQGW